MVVGHPAEGSDKGNPHTWPMFLPEPPPSELAAAFYEDDRESDGYINNLTRLWCWRPDLLQGFIDLRGHLMDESELTEDDIAVLVTATAAARSDSYCALAWGTRLADRTDVGTAAAVLAGTVDDLDPRRAGLTTWARQVVADPNAVVSSDVERLRDVGLSDRAIFEATLYIALRLAFSTVNDALGAAPDLELAQRAPARVRDAITFGRRPS
jgi:alkylhydroperoxidase family enzyme